MHRSLLEVSFTHKKCLLTCFLCPIADCIAGHRARFNIPCCWECIGIHISFWRAPAPMVFSCPSADGIAGSHARINSICCWENIGLFSRSLYIYICVPLNILFRAPVPKIFREAMWTALTVVADIGNTQITLNEQAGRVVWGQFDRKSKGSLSELMGWLWLVGSIKL